jgi:hypothetical protein
MALFFALETSHFFVYYDVRPADRPFQFRLAYSVSPLTIPPVVVNGTAFEMAHRPPRRTLFKPEFCDVDVEVNRYDYA